MGVETSGALAGDTQVAGLLALGRAVPRRAAQLQAMWDLHVPDSSQEGALAARASLPSVSLALAGRA